MLVGEVVLGVGALPARPHVLLVPVQLAVRAEVVRQHLPLPGGSVDRLMRSEDNIKVSTKGGIYSSSMMVRVTCVQRR